MFWTLNPTWFYLAISGVFVVIILHTVANRFAPKVLFPWVGFFNLGLSRSSLFLRLRDYLVVIIRSLIVFSLFLILAKPFLYKGKPPKEIWIKDVPPEKTAEILGSWGKFAEIRFSPSEKPKGKVALVGNWDIIPNAEYEIWGERESWKVLEIEAGTDEIKISLYSEKPVKLKIRVISKETSISDEIEFEGEKLYTLRGKFSGEVLITLGGRKFYDYVLEGGKGGEVFGKGTDREVIINALKVTGADLRVGIDTVFPGLDMVFVRKCEILKGLGINYRREMVEFIFSDSGCVFQGGKPLLYDERGNLVGVEFENLKLFGFSPSYTGFGFTPRFLRLLSLSSKEVWKVYLNVGDKVDLGENYEIRGKTTLCCPSVFKAESPGIYKAYKGDKLAGVIVSNLNYEIRVPEPPKPLENFVKIFLIFLLLLEVILTSVKLKVWRG
jgi:hypothetical protein